MNDLIEALQILQKYAKNVNWPTHCEHDILYISDECVDPKEVSEEDKAKLDSLGFHIDSDLDCFASFRFGSC